MLEPANSFVDTTTAWLRSTFGPADGVRPQRVHNADGNPRSAEHAAAVDVQNMRLGELLVRSAVRCHIRQVGYLASVVMLYRKWRVIEQTAGSTTAGVIWAFIERANIDEFGGPTWQQAFMPLIVAEVTVALLCSLWWRFGAKRAWHQWPADRAGVDGEVTAHPEVRVVDIWAAVEAGLNLSFLWMMGSALEKGIFSEDVRLHVVFAPVFATAALRIIVRALLPRYVAPPILAAAKDGLEDGGQHPVSPLNLVDPGAALMMMNQPAYLQVALCLTLIRQQQKAVYGWAYVNSANDAFWLQTAGVVGLYLAAVQAIAAVASFLFDNTVRAGDSTIDHVMRHLRVFPWTSATVGALFGTWAMQKGCDMTNGECKVWWNYALRALYIWPLHAALAGLVLLLLLACHDVGSVCARGGRAGVVIWRLVLCAYLAGAAALLRLGGLRLHEWLGVGTGQPPQQEEMQTMAAFFGGTYGDDAFDSATAGSPSASQGIAEPYLAGSALLAALPLVVIVGACCFGAEEGLSATMNALLDHRHDGLRKELSHERPGENEQADRTSMHAVPLAELLL